MPILRCLQAVTVAAVLFALLGACGLGPPRTPPIVIRPRPPRSEITIRSLTGTWDGAIETAQGAEPVTLRLLQSGDALSGSLTVRGRTLLSNPSSPARVDVSGGFALAFGSPVEARVGGRIDAGGDRIATQIHGLQPHLIQVNFHRH